MTTRAGGPPRNDGRDTEEKPICTAQYKYLFFKTTTTKGRVELKMEQGGSIHKDNQVWQPTTERLEMELLLKVYQHETIANSRF